MVQSEETFSTNTQVNSNEQCNMTKSGKVVRLRDGEKIEGGKSEFVQEKKKKNKSWARKILSWKIKMK